MDKTVAVISTAHGESPCRARRVRLLMGPQAGQLLAGITATTVSALTRARMSRTTQSRAVTSRPETCSSCSSGVYRTCWQKGRAGLPASGVDMLCPGCVEQERSRGGRIRHRRPGRLSGHECRQRGHPSPLRERGRPRLGGRPDPPRCSGPGTWRRWNGSARAAANAFDRIAGQRSASWWCRGRNVRKAITSRDGGSEGRRMHPFAAEGPTSLIFRFAARADVAPGHAASGHHDAAVIQQRRERRRERCQPGGWLARYRCTGDGKEPHMNTRQLFSRMFCSAAAVLAWG